jgi:uncharacterized protein with HEPN domain
MKKKGQDDCGNLKKIIGHCEKIGEHIKLFGGDEEDFLANAAFQDACAFNVIQIGEYVGLLSDDLINKYEEIEWRNIVGFRNIIAHNYGRVIPGVLWATVTTKVPELKEACERILKEI